MGISTYDLTPHQFSIHIDRNIFYVVYSDRSAAKDAPKSIRTSVTYAPLDIALQHRWSGLSKRQTKQMNPAVVFSILGAFFT